MKNKKHKTDFSQDRKDFNKSLFTRKMIYLSIFSAIEFLFFNLWKVYTLIIERGFYSDIFQAGYLRIDDSIIRFCINQLRIKNRFAVF